MSEVDTQFSLGKLIAHEAKRDAIHIAVAPVTAAMTLEAGQHIGFVGNNTVFAGNTDTNIGIVDPFLKKPVRKGERFWMFLYPNTITSLRHQWTHPGFSAPSEEWLKEFAAKYEANYDELLSGAINGEGYCFPTDLEYGDFDKRSEFWEHVEAVTGRIFTDDHKENTPFRCAC